MASRQAHNLKIGGSNPSPAPKNIPQPEQVGAIDGYRARYRSSKFGEAVGKSGYRDVTGAERSCRLRKGPSVKYP